VIGQKLARDKLLTHAGSNKCRRPRCIDFQDGRTVGVKRISIAEP
jgi:hypothetical protein